MTDIPEFQLYGRTESIQPKLTFRGWTNLSSAEKQTALQCLKNRRWIVQYSAEILQTMSGLNAEFLRLCPGKTLHKIIPTNENESARQEAARSDFETILLNEKSEELILRMLSRFAYSHIDALELKRAAKTEDANQRAAIVAAAFRNFDRLANCLNDIFEQFCINQVVTRNGFIPRQDEKVSSQIYRPTLEALSDPKWKDVSDDLAKMFDDYRNSDYAEVITKAHSSLQRFLQILVGEGKNGRGELAKLFGAAKRDGKIPVNRFTEPLVAVIEGFVPSERATKSTAKPALHEAKSPDALLVMNLVIVFMQFCLQGAK